MSIVHISRTSHHAAYHLYQRSVKHEITYLQRFGLYEDHTEDTVKAKKKMVETMVGGQIRSEQTWQQVSNQKRH